MSVKVLYRTVYATFRCVAKWINFVQSTVSMQNTRPVLYDIKTVNQIIHDVESIDMTSLAVGFTPSFEISDEQTYTAGKNTSM